MNIISTPKSHSNYQALIIKNTKSTLSQPNEMTKPIYLDTSTKIILFI